jgi:hypothetical protein
MDGGANIEPYYLNNSKPTKRMRMFYFTNLICAHLLHRYLSDLSVGSEYRHENHLAEGNALGI